MPSLQRGAFTRPPACSRIVVRITVSRSFAAARARRAAVARSKASAFRPLRLANHHGNADALRTTLAREWRGRGLGAYLYYQWVKVARRVRVTSRTLRRVKRYERNAISAWLTPVIQRYSWWMVPLRITRGFTVRWGHARRGFIANVKLDGIHMLELLMRLAE